MKAAVLTGIRKFEIKDVPGPKLVRDTDVKIKITMVGICGSDIHYYTTGRIGSQVVKYPFVVGHEAAGIVEQVGANVTRVKPGQRVAIDPALSCGQCDQCLAGRENTCRELLFMGNPDQLSGSMCEYVVMPEKSCYPISDSTTFEQAVLSEPLAIAVYAVEQSQVTGRDSVAILGAGPIGMSVFHVLREKDIKQVFITEKIRDRQQYARQLQPVWCGSPDDSDIVSEVLDREPLQLDVVYECSGDPQAILQGIALLKPGGKLVITGIPEVDNVAFPIHELRRKEIAIVNVRRQSNCTQKAIDLLAQCRIDMDAMATHHYKIDQIQEAFDLVANYRDGAIKVMITLE